MDARERLRQLIDEEHQRLRGTVPPDREAGILEIVRRRDELPHPLQVVPVPDVISGRSLVDPGGNLALQMCLDAPGTGNTASQTTAEWATPFLRECGLVAEASMVLRHVESGFMGLAGDRPGVIDAWITTRRAPATWRERADVNWWASWLVRQDPAGTVDALLARMTYQAGYPAGAVIGDVSLRTALDVLRRLIQRALRDMGGGPLTVRESTLVADISREIPAYSADVQRSISALTLDAGNASWHAAVPGIAAAPIVRTGPDRLVLSRFGLTTDPLLFLMRELRRRDPEGYHNAAHLREDVFRRDLYDRFADKRFVTSPGRIRVRHDAGNVRTDIDAAIFDRKTGTLGLFELKSQDPFARSTASLQRQRDNLLYANRQVSGTLDWINRHGADEILNRIDSRTARQFRVHRVYPFVLGRFLGRFDDGPAPDRRAAWGTWPGVLRAFTENGIRLTDANPIASLFTRLSQDDAFATVPAGMAAREIVLGDTKLIVHPDYAALQTA